MHRYKPLAVLYMGVRTLIQQHHLVYLKGDGKITHIYFLLPHTGNEVHITASSKNLGYFVQNLEYEGLTQARKNFAVNMDFVCGFKKQHELVFTIPIAHTIHVGRAYYKNVYASCIY